MKSRELATEVTEDTEKILLPSPARKKTTLNKQRKSILFLPFSVSSVLSVALFLPFQKAKEGL